MDAIMPTNIRDERNERIRDAMLLAGGDYQWKEIANDLNITPQNISTFISTRKISGHLQGKFEEWLTEKGYLNRPSAARETPPPYPINSLPTMLQMASLFDGLAKTAQAEGRCTAARFALIQAGIHRLHNDLLPQLKKEFEADTPRNKR